MSEPVRRALPMDSKEKEELKSNIIKILEKHSLDIESLGQNVNSIRAEIQQFPSLVQNIVIETIKQIQSSSQYQTQTATNAPVSEIPNISSTSKFLSMDKETQANVVAKVLDKVLDKVIGEPKGNFLGLDEEYIQEKIKNSVMGNFELGESLIDAVKAGFKRKTVGKMVSNV